MNHLKVEHIENSIKPVCHNSIGRGPISFCDIAVCSYLGEKLPGEESCSRRVEQKITGELRYIRILNSEMLSDLPLIHQELFPMTP